MKTYRQNKDRKSFRTMAGIAFLATLTLIVAIDPPDIITVGVVAGFFALIGYLTD